MSTLLLELEPAVDAAHGLSAITADLDVLHVCMMHVYSGGRAPGIIAMKGEI